MCGIFGVLTKDKRKYNKKEIEKIIEALFKLSESRGKEAAGIAVKSETSIDVVKSFLSASQFLKSLSYKKFCQSVFGRIDDKNDQSFLTIIGHSRLATHGTEYHNCNNQPVIKEGAVGVHNGIIVNDKQLWEKFSELSKEYEVDTEVFLSLLQLFSRETGIVSAAQKTFEMIEGSASVAVFFNNNFSLLLATNTGSLYICDNIAKDVIVFASERYILEQFIDKTRRIDLFEKESIQQLSPNGALVVNLKTLDKNEFSFSCETHQSSNRISCIFHPEVAIIDHSLTTLPGEVIIANNYRLLPEVKKEMEETWSHLYSNARLRRCAKCLLPETMTFIDFDEQGVCNYCRNYKKIQIKGEKALDEIVSKYQRTDGKPDCILPFSGGRDSSYGLHYIKKVLKMNPIAFTYDWGVMTDLGRRNAARLCGKLGVEHVILSADIRRKRRNIRKNLEAWFKKPDLGMVPLLMAGDKDMMYHITQMRKKTNIDLIIDCYGRGLEDDLFKIGFAGVRINPSQVYFDIPITERMRLLKYYATRYISNPSYINCSLFDTIPVAFLAFFHSYDVLHLYDYIRWNEQKIVSTIMDEYGWEKESDTIATWRIDDGTAAIYNYIYMTLAGFTEFDTLRSIQIREGQMSREMALNLIIQENKPRYESIEWYAKIIGFDCNKAIRRINSVPKLYNEQDARYKI